MDRLVLPNAIEDIFIHTWFDPSVVNKPMEGVLGPRGIYTEDADKCLIDNLKPKGIIVEPPRTFDEFAHLDGRYNQTHIASMGYSIMKVNQLKMEHEKKNKFVYDVVIKTRIDMNYHEKMIISEMIDDQLEKCLYVSQQYFHENIITTKQGREHRPLSDCFNFGASKNIDIVSSFFNHFQAIHDDLDNACKTGEGYHSYIATIMNDLKIVPKPFCYTLYRVGDAPAHAPQGGFTFR